MKDNIIITEKIDRYLASTLSVKFDVLKLKFACNGGKYDVLKLDIFSHHSTSMENFMYNKSARYWNCKTYC